jgi:diguanylate cyclase (GGDEF)-like protein/PAS domain S-box-containing protein
MQESIQYAYLRSLLSGFGLRATLMPIKSLDDGFALVANGAADAVASSYYFGEVHAAHYGLIATPIIFLPSQLFYVTAKGRNGDLLDAIDRSLAAWQADPDSLYFDVLHRWGRATPAPAVPDSVWWVLGTMGLLLFSALGIAALFKMQVARQTRDLQTSEARLNAILDSVDALIYIKDRQLRYQYGNRKVCKYFGLDLPDLIGHTDEDFFSGTPLKQIRDSDLRVIVHGERVAREEIIPKSDGAKSSQAHSTFFSIKIPLRSADGTVEALCGISTDVTEHRATQQAAHRLEFYDPLTGLPNRRLLLERLRHAVDTIGAGEGIGALLFIDLDNFKRINDARGHVVGDAVLSGIALRLEDLRPTPDTVIARVGGDEFVFLMGRLGRTPEQAVRGAMEHAERVRHALEQAIIVGAQPYSTGGSIGVTLLLPDGKSPEDILREANTAMHRCKASGRNRIAFFETSMQMEIEERLALEHDLSQAIGTEQTQMHLQPQYDRGGKVAGVELLMRWTHPVRGPIPPARFIPVAEETGLIVRIGDWTLQQACLTLLQLEAAGQTYPLSINVSPRQFRQQDFVSRTREILQETGAPAHRLVFEVTEGILIEDIQAAIDRMSELAALGIRFSIDDFGTGYSSLSYLKRLPLYELKIDKTFVQDVPADTDNAAIVKLILAMSRQLNLRVVAEGVETPEQLAFLTAHECDAMQGYYFARPVTIAQWLEATSPAA